MRAIHQLISRIRGGVLQGRLAIFSLIVALLALASWPYLSTAAPLSDGQRLQQAWQQATNIGQYHYHTDVVQKIYPTEQLENVGRRVQSQEISVEGQIDQAADRMSLRLESGGAGNHKSIDLRVEEGVAYGKLGAGDEWQEVEAGLDLFAPGGDPMGFLAAAQNVRVLEGSDDLLFEMLPEDYTQTITRYAFELDGPQYAQFMRNQMEAYLRQRGELPAGLRLDLVREYVTMEGAGEIWLDEQDLPVRQMLHLTFPAQTGAAEWVEATITTTFSDWDAEPSLLAAIVGAPASKWPGLLAGSLPDVESVRQGVMATVLLLIPFGFALLCITHRRSRRFYTLVTGAMFVSLLLGPLLQAQEVSAFAQRFAAKNAESMARVEASTPQFEAEFDPQANQLAKLPSDLQVVGKAAPLSQGAACSVDGEADSDCDGLSDGIERAKLGTDPAHVDSDGDFISDRREVEGFHDGQQWYLDPANPDSNGDGVLDNLECPELVDVQSDGTLNSAFVPGVCRNSDDDMTPDLFDFDNDGDGVPDTVDSAPFDLIGDPNSGLADGSFDFNLTLAGENEPIFATFEIRPTNPDHLWYTDNVLDWPSNDTQGQIMRVHDNTFADIEGYASNEMIGSKLTNGDILLTPLLEFKITYNPSNPAAGLPIKANIDNSIAAIPNFSDLAWLDTDALARMGISTNQGEDDQTLYLWVPLTVVEDSVGDGRVAWSGTMLYRPDADNSTLGNSQQVRLLWTVQALVDECDTRGLGADEDYDAYCADLDHWVSRSSFIQTYDESFYITGLVVREDHGGSLAMVTQPDGVGSTHYEDKLWHLADNLQSAFLGAQDRGDGSRFSVQDIPAAINTWGLGGLHVSTHTVVDRTTLLELANGVKGDLLNSVFPAATVGKLATILFVGEESGRTVALGDHEGQVNGNLLHVDLTNPMSAVTTNGILRWSPYEFMGSGLWENAAIADHRSDLALGLANVFDGAEMAKVVGGEAIGDFDTAQDGAILLAQNSYLALYAGIGMPLAVDFVRLGSGTVDNAALALPAGEEAVTLMVAEMVRAIQRYYGTTSVIESLRAGDDALAANSLAATFSTSLAALVEAVGLAAQGEASTTLTLALQTLGDFYKTTDVGTENFVQDATITSLAAGSIVGGYGDTLDGLYLAVKTVLVLNSLKSAYYYLSFANVAAIHAATTAYANGTSSAFATYVTVASTSAKVWAVITVVVTSAILWTFYAVSDFENNLQRSAALARTIAATITAVILAIISTIPVFGPLITAVISLIDLVAAYVCKATGVEAGTDTDVWLCSGISGALTRVIQYLIFDQYIVVDLKDKKRLQITMRQPTLGQNSGVAGFVAGNSVNASVLVTNTLSMAEPTGLRSAGKELQDKWGIDDWDQILTRSTFAYSLQTEQANNHHPLELDQVAWQNKSAAFEAFGTGMLATQGINQSTKLYLTESFHIPAIECWGFLIQFCKRTQYKDSFNTPIDLTFDVLPTTLDGFYTLVVGENEGFRLGWDERFPTLADADGDGLRSKAVGGPDPNDNRWDSDGDGLSDLWETQNGYNPLDEDGDDDGLSDYWEIAYGTHPYQADSDNDGLMDGDEFFHSQQLNAYVADNLPWRGGWTIVYDYNAADQAMITRVSANPLDYDSDDDSILDNAEQIYGYNPNVPSTLNVLSLNTEVANDTVAPSAMVNYSATVKNELENRIANGLLQAEFPIDVVQTTAVMETLSPQESVTMLGSVVAPAVSATTATSLTLRAGAVIQDSSTGRVLWLHLNEDGNATSFEDDAFSSGGPHNAACSGAACPTTDGGALSFNGSDLLTVADHEELNPTQFTLSAWVTAADIAGTQTVLAKGANGYSLKVNNDRAYATLYLADCTTPVTVDSQLLSSNLWLSLIATYDGARLALYLNGALQGSAPAPSLCTNANALQIGAGLVGQMDEVEIYPRALVAEEVNDLFNKPVFYLPQYDTREFSDYSDYAQSFVLCDSLAAFCPPASTGIVGNSISFNQMHNLTFFMGRNLALGRNDNTFSLAMWIYPQDDYTPDDLHFENFGQLIMGNDEEGYAKAPPSLYLKGHKLVVRFGHADGLGYCEATSSDLLDYNKWRHLLVTFDGNLFRVYLENTQVDAFSGVNCAGEDFYDQRQFYLGNGRSPAIYFTKVDNLNGASNDEGFIWSEDNNYNDGVGSLPLLWNSAENGLDNGKTVDINAWATTLKQSLTFDFCNRNDPNNGIPTHCDAPDNLPLLRLDQNVGGFPWDNSGTTHAYFDPLVPGAKTVRYEGGANLYYYATLHYNLYSTGFRGKLDEIRIYRSALSAEEAADLYEGSTRSVELPFDEPPGQDIFGDVTSNDHDAICTGTTCPDSGIPGRNNQSVRFDGVDDSLTLDTAPVVGLVDNNFTVMAWIKADALNGNRAVVGTDTEGATSSLLLGLRDGMPHMAFGSDPASQLVAPSAIEAGRWVHVAYRFDATTRVQSILVNGAVVATGAAGSALFNGTKMVQIGKALGGNYFDGLIDHVVIARRLLNPAEVRAAMDEAPVLYLHLDEDLNTSSFVDDAPRASHATCSGSGCPQAGSKGQMREAALFTGSRTGADDMLTIAHNGDYVLSKYTIGLWVKPNLSQSKFQPLVDKRSLGQINYSLLLLPDNRVRLIMHAGDCSSTKLVESEARITNGQWNHVMGTFDGTTMRLYINGVADINTLAYSGTPCLVAAPIRIGGQSGATWSAFDGMLDEISVYGMALDASEVRTVYEYQAAWVDEKQSHLITIDADDPIVTVEVHTEYLPLESTLLAVSALDASSPIANVDVTIIAPNGSSTIAASQDDAAWLFAFAPTQAGQYTLQATATDAVGNSSVSAPVALYVDSDLPSLSVDESLNGVFNGVTLVVTDTLDLFGTVSDAGLVSSGVNPNTMVVSLYDKPGEERSNVRAVTSDGATWAVEYPFTVPPYGAYGIWTSVEDQAGNRFDGTVGLIKLDAYGAIADVTVATNAISMSNSLLSGTVSDLPYPLEGRLLHLHFEESSNSTLFADSSEAHAAITCSNCPTAAGVGRYGKAVVFDGVDDYLQLPALLNPAGAPFTAAMWFKVQSLGTLQTLLQQMDGTGVGRAWLYLNGAGQIGTNLGGGLLATQPTVTANQWTHAAISYDGTTLMLYINGVAVAQAQATVEAADGALLLGVNKGLQSGFLRGALDEVVIYESALAPETILDMANPLGGAVSSAQIRIRHAREGDLGEEGGAWQPLTLANVGNNFFRWEYQLPMGMEGPYKIDLKATDTLGNSRYIPNAWSGDIDLLSPRIAFHFMQSAGGHAEVECVADDYNIDVTSWRCPASSQNLQLEDAAWFVDAYAPYTRTVGIASNLEVVSLEPADDLRMVACDLLGNCASAEAEQNLPPMIDAGGPYSGLVGSAISLNEVSANDPEGDALNYAWSVANSNGENSGCTFDDATLLQPALTCAGQGSFTVTVAANDPLNSPIHSSALVTVTAPVVVNRAPVASDDVATTDEDMAVSIGVLTNDSDVDGDVLTVLTATQPLSGSVIVNGGEIVYTPAANEAGMITFVYTVTDGFLMDSALVTVTINAVNDAPVASDDAAQTNMDASMSIAVLGNDMDVDGDVLTVVALGQASSGTTTLGTDGSVNYAPMLEFYGTDSFTYTVADGRGGEATALVTVTVNQSPVTLCNLYPIALHRDQLLGLRVGQLLEELFGWDARGSDFELFTWNGDTSLTALLDSLTPPGNSHTYTNPLDPTDHQIDRGDWVQSLPNIRNTARVREVFDELLGDEIVVPVWSLSTVRARNSYHRVIAFARIRLTDYNLTRGTISATFLGRASCGDIVSTSSVSYVGYGEGEFVEGELEDGEFVDPWPAESEPSDGEQPQSSLFLPLVQDEEVVQQSAQHGSEATILLPYLSNAND